MMRVVLILLVLVLAGCNAPISTPAPPATDAADPATPPPTLPPEPVSAATPSPSPMPTPAPTPLPSELVWFAPNMGSTDYPELFTRADQWAAARQRIDVLKFYTQNVLDVPCPICGENTLRTFVDARAFSQLQDWGLATAIEVGAVKEWACTGDEEFRVAHTAVRNVRRNGGKVTFLAMDEPLLGGQHVINGRTCGYTMEQSAAATGHFVQQVSTEHPDIIVGDIEPYPHFSVAELQKWILQLEEKGVAPAFFHLDVDIERVRVEGQDVMADLQALSEFCGERGIAFGVIFTSNWRAAESNRAYYDSTMKWVKTVKGAIGKPQHAVFQSWQGPAPSGAHEVPVNLPEDDPAIFSHARLVVDGLAVLDD